MMACNGNSKGMPGKGMSEMSKEQQKKHAQRMKAARWVSRNERGTLDTQDA